jgi:hypothetical protein
MGYALQGMLLNFLWDRGSKEALVSVHGSLFSGDWDTHPLFLAKAPALSRIAAVGTVAPSGPRMLRLANPDLLAS